MGTTAAVVDSRNVLGQVAEVTALQGRPTPAGVRSALAALGFDVGPVHVGLALPRSRDGQELAAQEKTNRRYMELVQADPDADVLLGELHVKQANGRTRVEEKMVDGACTVRIVRYIEEILRGDTDVTSVVVLSKDIDLQPAVQYGEQVGVPVVVAATNVVHRRPFPHVLLPTCVLPGLVGSNGTGHEHRNRVATMASSSNPAVWTVRTVGGQPTLCDQHGLRGVPARGVKLARPGREMRLYLVDVDFTVAGLEGFPVPVLDTRPSGSSAFETATLVRRSGPLGAHLRLSSGAGETRTSLAMGTANPGDELLIQAGSGRVIGRASQGSAPTIDHNTAEVLDLVQRPPKGGFIGLDSTGRRGLLSTLGSQTFAVGDRVPVTPAGENRHGPTWFPLGTALPKSQAA